MSIFFSPGDVFEIAIEIEGNGARFYRTAANAAHDPATSALLLELAGMESDHEVTFIQLKADLVDEKDQAEWYDQGDEACRYLQTFASGQVFDLRREHALAPDAATADVLAFAMDRERDSILFYLGIKEWVPAALAGGRIEKIITEEMRHMAQLNVRRMELIAS